MKKIVIRKAMIVIVLLCLVAILSACNSLQMLEHYSRRDNYVNATGTVTYISYNEDYTSLYFTFSELTPKFDDDCFKIVGNSLSIVQERGIDQKIQIGDQINFVTAPKYFGDGYVMPIVAISSNGEELLGFEEGFANLLEWLS